MIGSASFTWMDAHALISNLPPGSALQRRLLGNAYTTQDVLLNSALNVLRHMTWQLSGGKKKHKPEPFWLPGLIPPSEEGRDTTTLMQGDRMTMEELDAILGLERPQT